MRSTATATGLPPALRSGRRGGPALSEPAACRLSIATMAFPKVIRSGNLLDGPSPREGEERFETLMERQDLRIERILSLACPSPEGFWCDQEEDEWVAVIAGEADLQIEGERGVRHLQRGDWVFLPAHCRHRVVGTSRDRPTVWLAAHLAKGIPERD
jgi:cupin 2 domain-containing protein